MYLPLSILIVLASAVGAWFAWRRLRRPWRWVVAPFVAAPAAILVLSFAGAIVVGWLGCEESTLWERTTGDGRFVTVITRIRCTGASGDSYNVLVVEQRPGGAGRTRAIWRSLAAPVPVAVEHAPPATFTVRAHDGSEGENPVPPASVTLEGDDLTPSRVWSFARGRPEG